MSVNNNPGFLSPEKVVVGFYSLLNEKTYDAAFDCLTPDFKERIWQNDGQRFADGYMYTLGIDQIFCLGDSQDNEKAEIHVHYRDSIDALHHPLLTPLPKATIADMPMVKNNIGEFKKLLLEELSADPKETNDILLSHFFAPNAVETCLWLSKADRTRDNELFTRSKETLQVYRRAICTNTPDGWLIDGLKRS